MDNTRMIANYFTLFHSARLLDARLTGARVREAYTQEKRRLCLTLEDRLQTITTLVYSCVPAENSVFLSPGSNRARSNAAELFPTLRGREIARVECDGLDRILCLSFTDGSELRLEFFGVRANALLFSPAHALEDCFLHKSEIMAPDSQEQPAYRTLSPLIPPEEAEKILGTRGGFTGAIAQSGRPSALAALKAAVPKLGAVMAEEMLFRAGIASQRAPEHIPAENLHALYDSSLQSVRDLLDCNTAAPRARIYWDGRRAVCFSLLRLESKAMYREERFDDLFEAVRRTISAVKAREAAGSAKESVHAWIERERARTERTIQKMREELSVNSRAAHYEMCGMLLKAHLHEVPRGAVSVALEDFNGATQTVALDPSLAPAQNAERYYQKAKHAKAAAREAAERLQALEAHAEKLRPLSAELADIETREEMKAFHARFDPLLKQLGYMTETEREQLPPFRIFTVEGGFQVLAGKSSENNDLLTTKYAKPNDLWFHARGSSGSHVVLKVGSAPGEPTKKAVHQAASIAAYYSKMKNASAVPVAMTEKKFVHKPKGVPAGTVTLDREKVIFVEPRLPETAQHI